MRERLELLIAEQRFVIFKRGVDDNHVVRAATIFDHENYLRLANYIVRAIAAIADVAPRECTPAGVAAQ
jgi:hypothetical protein